MAVFTEREKCSETFQDEKKKNSLITSRGLENHPGSQCIELVAVINSIDVLAADEIGVS